MNPDSRFVDAALRAWKTAVDRSDAFFTALTDEQLQQQVAPGRNRLAYLWGHLAAVHDRMIPLLGVGERLHPQLDAKFLDAPDAPGTPLLSAAELKPIWSDINAALWRGMGTVSAEDWLGRHTAVSEDDFRKEPHRHRFSVLLSRTAHLASHQGQVVLVKGGGE
jgi:hypothetical protein